MPIIKTIAFMLKKAAFCYSKDTHKISRAQLAFEIETSERQLSRIEDGQINSGILNYIKIARVLDVPLAELFKKVKI